jgi:hypothetical protein
MRHVPLTQLWVAGQLRVAEQRPGRRRTWYAEKPLTLKVTRSRMRSSVSEGMEKTVPSDSSTTTSRSVTSSASDKLTGSVMVAGRLNTSPEGPQTAVGLTLSPSVTRDCRAGSTVMVVLANSAQGGISSEVPAKATLSAERTVMIAPFAASTTSLFT